MKYLMAIIVISIMSLIGDFWAYYSIILLIFAVYSFFTSIKRRGKKRIFFIAFGSIMLLVFLAIISAPYINTQIVIGREMKIRLESVQQEQKAYFEKNNKYASSFEELGVDLCKDFWECGFEGYEYTLNDDKQISELGLKRTKNDFIAIAKVDKLGGIFTKAYYCPDVWAVGSNMDLTHVKDAYECEKVSIMSLVEALIFALFGLFALAFIVEQILHVKKSRNINQISQVS